VLAFNINSRHLDDQAKELSQLADGAKLMRSFMMPDVDTHQAPME
jgi:hypothetical protein